MKTMPTLGLRAGLSVRAEGEEHLALGPARLDARIRVSKPFQREAAVDHDLNLFRVDEGGKLGEPGTVGLHEVILICDASVSRTSADAATAHPKYGIHRLPPDAPHLVVEASRGEWAGDRQDAPLRLDGADEIVERRPSHEIEHLVETLRAERDRSRAVVDDLVGAQSAHQGVALGGCGRRHVRARVLRQLDREQPDAARTASDQEAIAPADREMRGAERLECGEAGKRDRRGLGQRKSARRRRDELFCDRDLLRERAEEPLVHTREHTVADREGRHAFTDVGDNAAEFVAGDLREGVTDHAPKSAIALVDIDRVESGGGDPDQYLTIGCTGLRPLGECGHLRATITVVHDRSHHLRVGVTEGYTRPHVQFSASHADGRGMRAVVYDRYGSPDELRVEEVAVPSPGEKQVLIEVAATSVNLSDWEGLTGSPAYARNGGLRAPSRRVLGSDIAGVVTAVGSGVTRFRLGDEVYGDNLALMGGFAEYALAPESALAHKPAELTFAEVSTLPQSGSIAIQGTASARHGQRVLINGAGGGAGTLAIQLAKLSGAHVTGVDNAGKLDFMRELGADEVVDYRSEDFTRREPYDLVLDLVAYRSVFAYRRAVARGGRYLMVGGTVRSLLRVITVGAALGLLTGRRLGLLIARPGPTYFVPVAERCITGDLRIHIDRTFTLDEVPEALAYVGEGHALGKVVVTIRSIGG